MGKYNDALIWYQKAEENSSNDEMINHSLGLCYFKLKDFQKAISYYTNSLKINEKYSDSYFDRAMAYKEIGEMEKAIKDLETFIEIAPEDYEKYKREAKEIINELKGKIAKREK